MSTVRAHTDIEAAEYYHGHMTKEDYPGLLENNGDFVVRLYLEKGKQLQYMICVNCGDSKEPLFKEYIIKRAEKKYTLDGQSKFERMVALIDNYVSNNVSLPTSDEDRGKEYFLKKGVQRASWELKRDWVTVNESETLGSGEFGTVCKGDLKMGNKKVQVAVKVATKEQDPKVLTETLKEARAMRNIEHPNIIKLFGIVIDKEPILLVIELVNKGSLISYLKKSRDKLTEKEKDYLAVQASWGIEYLHTKHIIHRDIAARNCLMNLPDGVDATKPQLKISDFGLSRVGDVYKANAARKLPVRFMSPEALNNGVFDSKSDVWAFGALTFEIYSGGKELYKGVKLAQVRERITKHDLQEIPEDFPSHAKEIIKGCWDKNLSNRLDMKHISNLLEKTTSEIPPICDSAKVKKKAKEQSKAKAKKSDTCQPKSSDEMEKSREGPVGGGGGKKNAVSTKRKGPKAKKK